MSTVLPARVTTEWTLPNCVSSINVRGPLNMLVALNVGDTITWSEYGATLVGTITQFPITTPATCGHAGCCPTPPTHFLAKVIKSTHPEAERVWKHARDSVGSWPIDSITAIAAPGSIAADALLQAAFAACAVTTPAPPPPEASQTSTTPPI
jgi:hypothetical protein